MRVNCKHGFFEFQEGRAGEVSDFILLSGLRIVPHGTFFTFAALENVPDHTIKGGSFLGSVATATHEGTPAELFRANGVVYDFANDLLIPLNQSTLTIPLKLAGNVYISTGGLIIPGSKTAQGRVEGFSGWFSFSNQRWTYSEVTLV